MQILQVDTKNPDPAVIDKAARVLQIGGLVVYPTETLYGLGANVIDAGAVNKVFEAKGRFHDKPISILFRDLEHAEKYAEFSDKARKIAECFLPGALTIILPAKVPLGEMFGGDRIAIRISSNRVAQDIMKRVKFPLTATSANISGRADPTNAKDVVELIGDKIDMILDSGKCEHSKPSTVVDLSGGEIVVVREGVIPRERIFEFAKHL